MKAALHENHLDCYAEVYAGQKEIEVTGESVVSDKLPDIGLLGETTANVILRGKRVDNAMGILEGDLQATVCYLPDGASGFCSLEINVPWQISFESEFLTDRSVLVGEVTVQQLETRLINPRKVLVKAQLCGNFSAYEKQSLTVCDEMEDDGLVQVRRETLACSLIGTVCEKTFVATDEYPLPAHLVGGSLLSRGAQFRIDDVKTLANKLIVKGSTISDVVIAQENGISERLNFTSSFSFIAETDCEEVSSDTRVSIMPTGLFYELTSDGRMLSAEIHGVCQMAAYTRHSLRYLSDAYSNFCSCEPEWSEMMVYLEPKNNIQRETVTVSLPARSQIAQIRFATAAIRTVGKNGQVPMSVSACVLYENGTMDWLKKQITATLPLKEMEQLTGVRAADLYTAANGTEAELRIALDGDVREERAESIRRVSAVELDREQRCCRVLPSVTVVRAEGQLWDLAREHGSTVALIQAYNQLEEETVAPNTLLLIPKQSQ